MTEQQLRQKVVKIMEGWVGCKESNGTHKKIIDLYNSHLPRARGYKMTYTDPWCATTVSAAFIKADLVDIAPTECSCSKMIELYKKKGRWKESDSYKPEPGDLMLYDWDDNGKGDCTGDPEHIGMVVSVTGSTIKVIEGNIKNAVGYRTMAVNGRYIRGYCLPDYASKASGTGSNAKPKADPAKSYDSAYGDGKGKVYTVTASALNMRTGANTTKTIIKALPQGSQVTCYGYYTQSGATIWLLIKDAAGDIGFCSKKYLK